MYLMYIDESGDPGVTGHASQHFILSGLIVHQDDWDKYLGRLREFRKALKNKYGLNQRTEIHAAELIRITKLEEYKKIRKTERINIIKNYCSEIPRIFDTAKIINVCIHKADHEGKDIFELAWGRLLQRYDTFLKKSGKDKGIIISDDTDNLKLRKLHRKMRVYNPINSHYEPFYNVPIDNIIEDGFMRDSQSSYFIQTVDVIAHALYRKEYPKGSLRKFGLEYAFNMIEPVLLKEASKYDELGIVRK